MKVARNAVVAVLSAVVLLSGCREDKVAEKYHPATLDSTEVKGIMRVTIDAKAAERIGLETGAVKEEKGRKMVPYGALMYDVKGDAWVFTSDKPLSFVRKPVVVETIEGDMAYLTDGPPAGTVVATVGAALLMGAERKYGH